jgi:acid phosphatase class B
MMKEISTDQKFATVSWDFDDTLAEYVSAGWYGGNMLVAKLQFLELLKEYHALGCKCIILTARTPHHFHIAEIEGFLKQCGIDHAVSDIVFTSHQPKGPFAKTMEVSLHYDDCVLHLESVREHGIRAISSI